MNVLMTICPLLLCLDVFLVRHEHVQIVKTNFSPRKIRAVYLCVYLWPQGVNSVSQGLHKQMKSMDVKLIVCISFICDLAIMIL